MDDFSTALQLINSGLKVARERWLDRGMWVALIKERENNPGYDVNTMGPSKLRKLIVIRNADNKIVPWVVSQEDILAEDWVLAP